MSERRALRTPTVLRRLLVWRDRRRRARRPPGEAWRTAIPGEVEFWDRWIRSGGDQWARDFEARLDPDRPLQAEVAALVDTSAGSTIRILDAGAGPATWLGKHCEGADVEITAVDALADDYNASLDAAGVEPPVRTIRCETERLSDLVGDGAFDLAFARNTLDHSYDPIACIRQLVRAVKPGGPVLLVHRRNEAEEEDYRGLHQWNFTIEPHDLVVWRPGVRHSARDRLAGAAAVERTWSGDGWDYALLRRSPGA